MEEILNEPRLSDAAIEAAESMEVAGASEYLTSSDLDPAKLLPYECRLEPEDPDVEKLPKVFKGRMGEGVFDSNESLYTG